jgi:hypothetical protein
MPGGGCIGFVVLDTFPLDVSQPPQEKEVFAWVGQALKDMTCARAAAASRVRAEGGAALCMT